MPSLNSRPYTTVDTDFGVTLLSVLWERWTEDFPGRWVCMLPGLRWPRVVPCVIDDYGNLVEVAA